ncbi:DNA-binding protein [Leisingera sp. McT4-56]|uniref:DNA-binding protein n=1 Tax=Leisingera sp. McT4-56 TaxID=2881255 RepID=UPI001CF90BB9|nr:DNA-binding protein [Leisingera sp. McT4-56]MCB4457886.1 DNA-binding protein [Leisingera sp. McT4-56]
METKPAIGTEDSPGLQENSRIAEQLNRYSNLLESQGGDGFRIRAYRNAAARVAELRQPLRTLYQEGGGAALIGLPAIGRGIAAAIAEILTTGRWQQLDRLQGETGPEDLFQTVPGIGPALASRFTEQFDAQTLEDLETALRNPRMKVSGLGPRRRSAILAALSGRLEAIRRIRAPRRGGHEPPVQLLLEADAIYRTRAAAGKLRTIAPRRFNPEGKDWLPVLHLTRGGWHLTLLFSNSARAHALGRTADWVLVFCHFEDEPEMQFTVVTQRQGPLEGRRVVRGRESECARYWAGQPVGN